MRHNLEALGLSPVTQREFWAIFAAVVLLGDVEIKADADGNAVVFAVDGIDADSPHALARACVLLGVDVNEFEMALLSKPVGGSVTGSVTTAVRLQRDEAAQVRDAMSVMLWEKVFQWLVSHINHKIMAEESEEFSDSSVHLGILDLPGFEVCDSNSLETLCINFADEMLQQLLYANVFVAELEDYRYGCN